MSQNQRSIEASPGEYGQLQKCQTAEPWRMEDLIDFEFFLETDRSQETATLEQRDREFIHELVASCAFKQEKARDRRQVFRYWLAARRRERVGDHPWPGEVFLRAWRLLSQIVILAGLILGGTTAMHLLRYDGIQPVNVATFLGWLVLLQVVLVGTAAIVVLLRRSRLLSTEISWLTGLVAWGWKTCLFVLNRHVWDRIPADYRLEFKSALGTVCRKGSLFGPVLAWPIFGQLQLFGLCFNLGAIGMTLALIVFSDRAFGWQSAVNFSANDVHDFVRGLAKPWSPWIPAGVPSLAQIEGSRIILKDGIRQLATENLVSWWPFLCLAVTTYGFLPRLLLWWWARLAAGQTLRTISFEHAACDRLWERFQAEPFQTQGEGPERPAEIAVGETADIQIPKLTAARRNAPAQGALLLIEPELRENQPAFQSAIRQRFGLEAFHCVVSGFDPTSLNPVLFDLQRWRWPNGPPTVILVQEAWQPAIAEHLSALRLLRQALDPAAKIIVALIGRPSINTPVTAVNEGDRDNWQRQLAALNDPRLRLETLLLHD